MQSPAEAAAVEDPVPLLRMSSSLHYAKQFPQSLSQCNSCHSLLSERVGICTFITRFIHSYATDKGHTSFLLQLYPTTTHNLSETPKHLRLFWLRHRFRAWQSLVCSPLLAPCRIFSGTIDADPYIPGGGGAQWYANQNNLQVPLF